MTASGLEAENGAGPTAPLHGRRPHASPGAVRALGSSVSRCLEVSILSFKPIIGTGFIQLFPASF